MIHYWVVLSPFSPRVIAATLDWAPSNRCTPVVFPSCSYPSSYVTRCFPYLHVCLLLLFLSSLSPSYFHVCFSLSSSMSQLQLLLSSLSLSIHESLSTPVPQAPSGQAGSRYLPLRSSPRLQRRLSSSMFTSSLIRSDVCRSLLSRLHSSLLVLS